MSVLRQMEQLALVPTHSSTNVVLAAMRQLQGLTPVLLNISNSSLPEADVQLLLSAVRHVQSVHFQVLRMHANCLCGAVQRAERVY